MSHVLYLGHFAMLVVAVALFRHCCRVFRRDPIDILIALALVAGLLGMQWMADSILDLLTSAFG